MTLRRDSRFGSLTFQPIHAKNARILEIANSRKSEFVKERLVKVRLAEVTQGPLLQRIDIRARDHALEAL
ncbi:MAG: hypothetical protein RL591_2556 [Planctomycetota bacterium]